MIDDDNRASKLIGKKFREGGFSVVICHDGQSAIKRAREEDFDAIVLDLVLPDNLSGINVLEFLRSEPKTTKTPIIVYTNYDNQDFIKRSNIYGADEFLLKLDASPEKLYQAVNQLITKGEIEKV